MNEMNEMDEMISLTLGCPPKHILSALDGDGTCSWTDPDDDEVTVTMKLPVLPDDQKRALRAICTLALKKGIE